MTYVGFLAENVSGLCDFRPGSAFERQPEGLRIAVVRLSLRQKHGVFSPLERIARTKSRGPSDTLPLISHVHAGSIISSFNADRYAKTSNPRAKCTGRPDLLTGTCHCKECPAPKKSMISRSAPVYMIQYNAKVRRT